MIQGAVSGQRELRHVQSLLLGANERLQRRVVEETRAALKPTKDQIKAAAEAYMPSGYGPILAPALRVTTRVQAGSTVRAYVTVSAKGKVENRDVATLNYGRLRHPLFGRRGKGHWFTTRVKPRFVSDPIDRLAKRVGDGAEKAANDVADTIVEG